MNYVAVDLGASNTRFTNNSGKIYYLPNNVAFIKDISTDISIEIQDDTLENNLDVTITKEGDSKYFPVRVLIGTVASRLEYSQTRPSQMVNKVEQPINYVSAIMAIAISKIKNDNLGNDINLFAALPPSEVQNYKDVFKAGLVGKYTVTFNMLGKSITFDVKNVACYEESRLALMQFLFDVNHPERLAKFSNANILSIDIGASTTDLVVFMSGKYLDRTGRTYKIGMNLAKDYVARELSAELGTDVPLEIADRCLVEGRCAFGNSFKDKSDLVARAKSQVAAKLISTMDTYFSSIGIPLTIMNYIVVSGGGSMNSGYIDDNGILHETSKPMSEFITDALKEVCPGTEVIHFGDEPRLANIKGLGMISEIKKGEIDK